ncbi:aldehyde dehydrogenase family protein [Sphaerisporangium sp. NPDC051011]|uniref:aldehyde dehydrogenase family protein n=1 Tax=Sphaerisporangium sp. NPDC051011 TaxID=3155792 RepID=UPI0033CB7D57
MSTTITPATQQAIADVAEADEVEVDRAVRRARVARERWAAQPIRHRAAALRRIADAVRADLENLAGFFATA